MTDQQQAAEAADEIMREREAEYLAALAESPKPAAPEPMEESEDE